MSCAPRWQAGPEAKGPGSVVFQRVPLIRIQAASISCWNPLLHVFRQPRGAHVSERLLADPGDPSSSKAERSE